MAKTKTTDNQGSLEDFTWDAGGKASKDFFGVAGSGATEEPPVTAEEVIKNMMGDDDEDEVVTKIEDEDKDKKKDTKKKKKEEVEEAEEEEEVEFFADPNKPKKKETKKEEEDEEEVEEEEEDETDEDDEDEDKSPKEKKDKVKPGDKSKSKPDPDKQTDGQFFYTQASELIERGIFQHAKLPEGKEELEEEEYFDLQDQEVEGRVQETFEAFAEEMDNDGKDFIKFKKNGGRTIDFLNVYVNSPLPDFGDQEFNPKNEAHRKEVIESYLTLVDDLDADEIKDRLLWMKEQGKDQVYAEKYYDKLVAIDAKQKAAVLEKQETEAKKKAESAKEYVKTVSTALNKINKVGNFKITNEDKKKLETFITKPTVKVGKNKFIPAFNSKLGEIIGAKTPEAQQKLILLAKLLNDDFDLKDLEVSAETKVTRKAKSKLRDAKNGVKPSSSGSYTTKSLSDFF